MEIVILDAGTLTAGDIDFFPFKKLGRVTMYDFTEPDEVLDRLQDKEYVIVNKVEFTRDIIAALPNLKYIGLFATGYNNIDLIAAREHGVTVCNAGAYSTDAVAQQTFGYILNEYTRISDYSQFVMSGGWTKSTVFSPFVFPTDEIAGKTLGIIGYGSIGKKVAKIAEAFGMNVVVHNRTVRQDGHTRYVSLDELLSNSDIISLHCPLTAENKGMFNAELFAKCKKGAYFINTARGGLVDEQALFDALENGQLSGAALDVIGKEPMQKECVLLKAKNITITPHSAWTPTATRQRVTDIAAENLRCFLNGTPQNVIV